MTRDELLVRFACAALTGIMTSQGLAALPPHPDDAKAAFDLAEMMLAEKDHRASVPPNPA